jgi:membrane-bound lytic murein transglycosylase B
MMRLEAVAKDLVEKLKKASPEQQRRAVLIACQIALDAAQIENPAILNAFDQLQRHKVFSQKQIEDLSNLAEYLDEQYFELQADAEGDSNTQKKALNFFTQARMASALSFAGADNALMAAMEAIYEASATCDDDRIFKVVENTLIQ